MDVGNMEALCAQIVGLPLDTEEGRLEAFRLVAALPIEQAHSLLCDYLYTKATVARYEPRYQLSLELAQFIALAGNRLNIPEAEAIGKMLDGDYHNLVINDYDRGWEMQQAAGELFLNKVDLNLVGWARTRIGTLLAAAELGSDKLNQAIADIPKAERILDKAIQLLTAAELGPDKVSQVIADMTDTEGILERAVRQGHSAEFHRIRLFIVYTNAGILHWKIGEYAEAVQFHMKAKQIAFQLDKSTRNPYLAWADNNIGTILGEQGYARRAASYLVRAMIRYKWIGNVLDEVNAAQNLARAEKDLGMYAKADKLIRDAIDKLREAYPEGFRNQIFVYATLTLVECYLDLNDCEQAAKLIDDLLSTNQEELTKRSLALIHYLAGLVHAELGHNEVAKDHFSQASVAYMTLELRAPAAAMTLYIAKIDQQEKKLQEALQRVDQGLKQFDAYGMEVEYAHALLIAGHILLEQLDRLEQPNSPDQQANTLDIVEKHAAHVLRLAQQKEAGALGYEAYVLLGRVAEKRSKLAEALKYYASANQIIDELQYQLKMAMRPNFLGNKGAALHSLLALRIKREEYREAFNELEQSKSRTMAGYLAEHNHLTWNNPFGVEADRLRGDVLAAHNRASALFSTIAPERRTALHFEGDKRLRNALFDEIGQQNEKLRHLVEQNRRESLVGEDILTPATLQNIQNELTPQECLVEYYLDGTSIYAFIVRKDTIQYTYVCTMAQMKPASEALDTAIGFALLAMERVIDPGPGHDEVDIQMLSDPLICNNSLRMKFDNAAETLYMLLLQPLRNFLRGVTSLFIVPYGVLHMVPFHLLGYRPVKKSKANPFPIMRYMIEDYDIAILPTASFLHRCVAEPSEAGITVVIDSHEDKPDEFQHAIPDAKRLTELFGGALAPNDDIKQLAKWPRRQILQFIAHGAFYPDYPHESFMLLNKTSLTNDDIIRLDLRYQLITLASCDVGKLAMIQNKVAAGDDQIGLGRAFLHAGAEALVLSRWEVGDGMMYSLLRNFYSFLMLGYSKASALRQAQLALHRRIPRLNPVFWGALQLVGNPYPLRPGKNG